MLMLLSSLTSIRLRLLSNSRLNSSNRFKMVQVVLQGPVLQMSYHNRQLLHLALLLQLLSQIRFCRMLVPQNQATLHRQPNLLRPQLSNLSRNQINLRSHHQRIRRVRWLINLKMILWGSMRKNIKPNYLVLLKSRLILSSRAAAHRIIPRDRWMTVEEASILGHHQLLILYCNTSSIRNRITLLKRILSISPQSMRRMLIWSMR